jgi:hypothetical protein
MKKLLFLFAINCLALSVSAQADGTSDAELAKKAQNPVANMYSLPFRTIQPLV